MYMLKARGLRTMYVEGLTTRCPHPYSLASELCACGLCGLCGGCGRAQDLLQLAIWEADVDLGGRGNLFWEPTVCIIESPMWVWPRSPPFPHYNSRTLPSSHDPSLPIRSSPYLPGSFLRCSADHVLVQHLPVLSVQMAREQEREVGARGRRVKSFFFSKLGMFRRFWIRSRHWHSSFANAQSPYRAPKPRNPKSAF